MMPKLATLLCYAFIAWLFFKDRKWHKGVSQALWIPLIWAFILGSKPITLWFSYGGGGGGDDYVEGSPGDRIVFLGLLAAAYVVLSRRQVNWNLFFQKNKWLCIYFLYLGVSCVWSDESFVSFKRWIKDVGNILMVLVVLTEKDPLEAVKALLARCTYLLIPLSVLLIKYYPDIGRSYNRWTYQPYFCGVTTDKNILGMLLYVCGLSIAWIILSLRDAKKFSRDKAGMAGLGLLVLMTLWLLLKSQSSTALGSTIMAIGIFMALRIPAVRSKVRQMGVYGIAGVSLLLLLHLTLNLGELFVAALGRDLTFTGRTDIWEAVLKEPINPLIGTGFYSFWLGDRVDRLSEKYFYHLNEAHNGFIEAYLNSGLIGIFLLAMVFVAAYKNIRKEVMAGSSYGAMKLAFMIITLIYNMTEATFDRLNLIWFALLLTFIEYPAPRKKENSLKAETPRERAQEGAMPHASTDPIGVGRV
jgi:exopolysaccharide production protein ExoQ